MKKPMVTDDQSKPVKKITKEEVAREISKMRELDATMVTGVFHNLENPASSVSRGSLRFTFRMYPNEDPISYEFIDGEKYTIPYGVAKHLNRNCYYYTYKAMPSDFFTRENVAATPNDGLLRDGTGHKNLARNKVHRFTFSKLDFMDDDMDFYQSDLTEVTSGR